MQKIILASQSPRRKQLLEWAEIDFEVEVSAADETFSKHLPVEEVPVFIARNKAKAVQQNNKNVDYAISLLSAADGETKLFAQNETASHVVAAAVPGQQYQQIKTQTLDALLESLHFPFPELLKLDVQGHEMEVLKGAVKSLEYATICLLEISLLNLGDDGPLMAEMIRFMDEKGYQAYDISQFIRRPYDKALYQVDMFFIKKDSAFITDKRWS